MKQSLEVSDNIITEEKVEREFLNKYSVEELVAKIIKSHIKSDPHKSGTHG